MYCSQPPGGDQDVCQWRRHLARPIGASVIRTTCGGNDAAHRPGAASILSGILYIQSLGPPFSCISSREGLIPAASNPVLLGPIQIHVGLNAL